MVLHPTGKPVGSRTTNFMANIRIDLEKIRTADFRTEDKGRVAAAEIVKRREEKQQQPTLLNKLLGKKKDDGDYKVSDRALNTQNLYEEMDRVETEYVGKQISKEKHIRNIGAVVSYAKELVVLVVVLTGLVLGWTFLNGHSMEINKATDVVFEKADEVVNSTSSNKEMKKEMDAYKERINQNQAR